MTETDPIKLAMQMAPSPCRGICRIDTRRDQCIGCYRFKREVGIWRALSQDDRFRILGELPQRYDDYKAFVEEEGIQDGFPEDLFPAPDLLKNRPQ